ncbi:MAG: site-specific DNA-methyltransferase [Nitrospiraceae bacterium]|nr:site-specific DNA-methyltransferase [Nitrospiraceae bacterium]
MDVTIIHGDCLEKLKELPDNSIDFMVTDPPYGIGLFGKDWDKAVPTVKVWKECLRVLKPGAFAFVMSIPRQDCLSRMMVNLSDAGFNTAFTSIYHAFASGVPKIIPFTKIAVKKCWREGDSTYIETVRQFADYLKSQRAKKGFSKRQVDKEICGNSGMYSFYEGRTVSKRISYHLPDVERYQKLKKLLSLDDRYDSLIAAGEKGLGYIKKSNKNYGFRSKRGNDAAEQDEISKMLSGVYSGFQPKPAVEVIIVCQKPLKHSSYIDHAIDWAEQVRTGGYANIAMGSVWLEDGKIPGLKQDRFPANLLVSDHILDTIDSKEPFSNYFDLDAWFEERIKKLPEHIRETFPFLITPKPCYNKKEVVNNTHPTVKSIALMSYLITLCSREGDVGLDPYLGSGTTAVASRLLNRKCIGIEINEEFVKIAESRTSV